MPGCCGRTYAGSLRRMRRDDRRHRHPRGGRRGHAPAHGRVRRRSSTSRASSPTARRRRRSAPRAACRSTCAWCRPAAGAPRCSTSPARRPHNVRTRELAVRQGLKLSEYGLFDARDGRADRRRDRGGGLRAARPAVDPAHAARGPGRGRGRAARASCPTLVSSTDIRGDLHTHTDLTDGVATLEQMVETAAGPAATRTTRSPTTRRTCYMQRMTDEKMLAQRAQLRARCRNGPEDDAAARHRAEHRPGRRGRLGRGVPRGVRRLRGVGALALQPAAGGDDARGSSGRARTRTSTSSGTRPPGCIGQRPPIELRPRRGVPGGRADGHRAGDQLVPRPARPAATSTSCGPSGTG